MKINFGNSGDGTLNNFLETWLRSRSNRDGVAITAEPSGDPENVNLPERSTLFACPVSVCHLFPLRVRASRLQVKERAALPGISLLWF